MFWVISVYFNIRNTLPKFGTFLLGHPVYRRQQNDNGVRAGIANFMKGKLEEQLKYKLHNNYSNNQAEQMAIVKAIEAIGNIHIRDGRLRTATIYTDSRVTVQSLKNHRNHKNLIEEIRKKSNIT